MWDYFSTSYWTHVLQIFMKHSLVHENIVFLDLILWIAMVLLKEFLTLGGGGGYAQLTAIDLASILWVRRVLFWATPAVTWGPGFCGLLQMITPTKRYWGPVLIRPPPWNFCFHVCWFEGLITVRFKKNKHILMAFRNLIFSRNTMKITATLV